MGRLTRDPEVRYSQVDNSTAVARFTLAVDRRFKRQGEEQTADFISCVTFGKTAQFVENYLKQGTKIAACGRIQTGSYMKEGQKIYTTEVVLEEVEFAESKNASANSGMGDGVGYQPVQRPEPSQAVNDGFMNIPDEIDEAELPFK